MKDVFDALKALIEPHTRLLDIKRDEPGSFYVDTFHVLKNKKPLFFGAVQAKKNYVSYHLMPVYLNPRLLDGVSPELGNECREARVSISRRWTPSCSRNWVS